MATVITRTFASTPQRTAGETWDAIVSVLAPNASNGAQRELKQIAGVAAALLASEATRDDAIFVYGNGPQVRVYCVFGDDAITGDGVDERPLQESPTEGAWRLSLPCPAEDLDWVQKKLKAASARISARAVGEKVEYEDTTAAKSQAGIGLNLAEFLRP